jgi:hypothetical protein
MTHTVSTFLNPPLTPVTGTELAILIVNGMALLPLSFVLLSIGPAYISAPEVSLYTLIETVLGPVWVWLGGFEAPPVSAMYGGSILILALGVHR